MKKIDASGAQSALFAVPEIGSRVFLDALFKMPRAYRDDTPKGAVHFAPLAVPEIGSRAFLYALFKIPRAFLDALFKLLRAFFDALFKVPDVNRIYSSYTMYNIQGGP